jgi:hypothetical protein
MRLWSTLVALSATVLVASSAFAQTPPVAPTPQKVIGRAGATQLEVSGSLDKSYTESNTDQPTTYFVSFGVGQFVTDGVLIHGNLVGSGQFGGADLPSIPGIPDEVLDEIAGGSSSSLFGRVGAKWYFSPSGTTSGYLGGLYSATLTNRQEGDNGSLLGSVGTQTALSPQASFYFEVNYGFSVSSNSFGERQQSLGMAFGLRFLF